LELAETQSLQATVKNNAKLNHLENNTVSVVNALANVKAFAINFP
jgi:hypothetical protein